MDGGLSVQCGIRDSLSFARTTWMDELPRWQRLSSAKLQSGKKCRKVATSFFVLMEDAWVLHPGCVRFHAQCILPRVRDALHAFVHLLHLAFNHLQQSILICRRPLQYALRQLCLHIQGDVRLEDPSTTHQDSAFHHQPRPNHPGRNCWNDIFVGHFHICDTCQNLASGSLPTSIAACCSSPTKSLIWKSLD